jgi:hypothetical protein
VRGCDLGERARFVPRASEVERSEVTPEGLGVRCDRRRHGRQAEDALELSDDLAVQRVAGDSQLADLALEGDCDRAALRLRAGGRVLALERR